MNLRGTNLFLIIWLLNTVTENVAFITQPEHKDNHVSLKSLQSVDEAASDVTLNLIKSLCSCLREKLKKQKTFNGETNLLLAEDEAGLESDIDFYKDMYNRTCADLHQTTQNINSEIVKDNKEAVLNQNLQNDVTSIKQYQNSTAHPRKKEFRLLYNALIKGINNHTYKIQKYPLYKHNVTFNSEDKRSVIVIITLLPIVNNSILQQSSYSVTENEVNQTLNTNSLVDIHIIDSMFTNKYEIISPVKKCHLYSLYIFIIESGRKNSIKNFKLLRVKGTIKMYIDVLSKLNLENFPDQCCNKSLLTLCKNRINSEKNDFTDKYQVKYEAQQQNVTLYKNIISKIKNLINLYNAKIIQEDRPKEKFLSKNCNDSQYFFEKNNASTTKLSNIDTGIPSVPQNSTTKSCSESTKGFGEYSLSNNTSSQNTTVNKAEKTYSYSTITKITTRSEEENIKPKNLQNLEKNMRVGENSKELFTEKTFLGNQTFDITRIKNENIMNFSVKPKQITRSVSYESRTTMVPLTSEKNLNMQNIQVFPMVISTSSTASYKINDKTYKFLKTETINTTENTIRGTYQDENIQPRAKTNKRSSFTLFTLGDNSTESLTKKISRANRTLNLFVTMDENRSRIPADIKNHTNAVTLPRTANITLQNGQILQVTTPTLSTTLFMANKENEIQMTTKKYKPLSITRIVTSTKNNVIIEPNILIGKTDNTMISNQTIDLMKTNNETKSKMNLPVKPIQFASSTELKNHTTIIPISKTMDIKLSKAQILQMVTPSLSKESYITNEENQTLVNLNIFQPPLTAYDITNMKNKSVVFPNTITKTPQNENMHEQTIRGNAKSSSKVGDDFISNANVMLENKIIDLSTTKDDTKTIIDFSVTPVKYELPEELENPITVVPLPRKTDIKQNMQILHTEKSTLLKTSFMTTEEYQRQVTNKSTPYSTIPIIKMAKNKQINVPYTPKGRLQEESIKPTIVGNRISTAIMGDNSTEILRENTLLTNQTSPLFITKKAYKISNFLVTPALDVVKPIKVLVQHNDTENLNKISGATRNNQAVTFSSKIATELKKYKLDKTVRTSFLSDEIDKYSQKNWLKPSNKTLLKTINANNKSNSVITTHFLTTKITQSQAVPQNLSWSTTNFKISYTHNKSKTKSKSKTSNNFSVSYAPVVSENDVTKNNLNKLVINTSRIPNTARVNHLNTLSKTIDFKEDFINDYILTSTEPLRTEVYYRASVPSNTLSPLSELLTKSTIGNQIESSTGPSLLNNSAIFNMDKTEKQMEENADSKTIHVLKDKKRTTSFSNSFTSTNISHIATIINKPFSSQTETNTIYPLSALASTTQVLNETPSNQSYSHISKNEFLENTVDLQEEVTQILSHNKKISQTIVPIDYLLSKTTTPQLITDKNRLPRVSVTINNDKQNMHSINRSKAETFSTKLISTKIKHQPKTYLLKPKYNKLTTPIVLELITQKVNNNLNKSTSKDWFVTKNFYVTKKPTTIWSQDKNDTGYILENLDNNSKIILSIIPKQTPNRNNTCPGPIITGVHNKTNNIVIDLSVTPMQSRVYIGLRNRTTMMSNPRATIKNVQNIQKRPADTPTLCTAYYKAKDEDLKTRKITVRNNLKEIYEENTFSTHQTIDLSITKKNYNKFNLIETYNDVKSPSNVTTAQVLVKDKYIEQPTLDPLRNTSNYVPLTNENSISQNLDQVTPYITNLNNKNINNRDKVMTSDGIKSQKQSTHYSPVSYYYHAPYTQSYSSTQSSNSNTKYESMLRYPSEKNVEGVDVQVVGKSPQNYLKLTTEVSNAAIKNQTRKLKLLTQNLSATPTQNIHKVFSPQGDYILTNLFKTTVNGHNFAVPLSEVIDMKLQNTKIVPTTSKMNKYQQGYLLNVSKLQPMTTYSSTNKEDNKNTLHETIPDTSTTKKQYTTHYVTQKNYPVSGKRQIRTTRSVLNNVRNKMRETITDISTEKCSKNVTEGDNNKIKILSDKDYHKITTTITSYQTTTIYDMNTTQIDKPHHTTLNNQPSLGQLKTNHQVTTKKILPLFVKDSEVKLTKFANPNRLETFLPTAVSLKILTYTKKPVSSKSVFVKDAKRAITTASTQLKIPINKMLKRNNKEKGNEIKQEIIPILYEDTTISSKTDKVIKMLALNKQNLFTLSAAFTLPNISIENTQKSLSTTGTTRSKQSKFLNTYGLEIPFPIYNSRIHNDQFQNQSIYKSSMKEIMKIDNTNSKEFHYVFVTSTHSSTKPLIKNISQVVNEIHPTLSTLFNEVNKSKLTQTMDTYKAMTPLPTSAASQIGKQASVTSIHLFSNNTINSDILTVNPTLINAKEYVSSKIFSSQLLTSTIPAPREKKHGGSKDVSRSTIEAHRRSAFKSNRGPTESINKLMKTMNLKLDNFTNFIPMIVTSLNSDIDFTKAELKMTPVTDRQHSNITYMKFLNKKPLDSVSRYKVKNTTPELTNLLNKISSVNKFTSLPEDKHYIGSAISTNIPPTKALKKLTAKQSNNIKDKSAITTTASLKHQDFTNKSVKRTPQILTINNISSKALPDLDTESIVTQTQKLSLKKHMPGFDNLSSESFMIKRNKSSSSHRNLPLIQQSTHLRYVQNNTGQQDGQIFKKYLQTGKKFNGSIGLSSTINEKKLINLFEIPLLTNNASAVMPLHFLQSAPLIIKKNSVLYTSTDYKTTLPSNIQLNKKSQESKEAILTTKPSLSITSSLYYKTTDPYQESHIIHGRNIKNTFKRDKAQFLMTPSIVTNLIYSNNSSDTSTVLSLSTMHENPIQTKNTSSKNTLSSSLGKNNNNNKKKNINKNKNLQQTFKITNVVLNISEISTKATKSSLNNDLRSTKTTNPNKHTTLGTKATSISRAGISTTYNGSKTNKISKKIMTPKTNSSTKLISDNHKLFLVESNATSKFILKSTIPTKLKMLSIRLNENITTKESDLTRNTSFYPFFENEKLLSLNNFSIAEINKPNHTKIISVTTQKQTKTEFPLNVITEDLKVNGYADSTQSSNKNVTHHKHIITTKYETYIRDPFQALKQQNLTDMKSMNKIGDKNNSTAFENIQDIFKTKHTIIIPPTNKSLKSNETYKAKTKELNFTRVSDLDVSTAKIISRYSHKFSATIFPKTHKVKLLASNQSIPVFIDTTKRIFNNTKQIIRHYNSTTKRDYANTENKFIFATNETLITTPRETNLKRLNQIYFTSLPKSMNVLLDINKNYNREQKKSLEIIKVNDLTKVLTTTAPVIKNTVFYVASPQINSHVVKFYQKLNLNTSTGENPKLFVGFNLTVDFEEKNKQNYNSTKMLEFAEISKNNLRSNKEHSKTVAVTPVVLSKSLEFTTRLRRKSKTIRYNTYKSMEDDLEITLKPHIISKYKLVKSNKYNNLITPLPRKKLSKNSHVLEKKNVILSTLKKTNPSPLTKYPSKPHRKVMKRIRLPNKDKEIIAMDTKDFFAHRKLSVKSNFKEILHKTPISDRTRNIATVKTKHHVIRPILEKIDGIIKPSRELYKPKPLFFTNNDDFYRKDFLTHHQNEALSLREKVNYIKSFPISNPNIPAETVIDIPMYLTPPNTKPKILRDRIDYIRNFLYNTELIKQTQLPLKTFVESTTNVDKSYRDPFYYFRKSGWYEDNFEDRTPTITTTRKPTKRQRRTIFFLSPTVPYNRYF